MPDDVLALLPRDLLDADDEHRLAVAIEAGVLAAAVLAGTCPDGGTAEQPGATADELALLVAEGEAAHRRFVEANLRLVVLVSRPVAGRSGVAGSDLFQEGCLGLLTAVERFDHRRGCRFATYALYWIRAYVSVAGATRLGQLNLPGGRAARLRTVRGIESALVQTLGRTVTVHDLAAEIGRTSRWTEQLMAGGTPVTLEEAGEVVQAGGVDAGVDAGVDDGARDRLVRGLLRRLPHPEREVISLRLGFEGKPLPYAQVALRMSLTVGRVRRIEAAAIARLQAVCPTSARDLIAGTGQ